MFLFCYFSLTASKSEEVSFREENDAPLESPSALPKAAPPLPVPPPRMISKDKEEVELPKIVPTKSDPASNRTQALNPPQQKPKNVPALPPRDRIPALPSAPLGNSTTTPLGAQPSVKKDPLSPQPESTRVAPKPTFSRLVESLEEPLKSVAKKAVESLREGVVDADKDVHYYEIQKKFFAAIANPNSVKKAPDGRCSITQQVFLDSRDTESHFFEEARATVFQVDGAQSKRAEPKEFFLSAGSLEGVKLGLAQEKFNTDKLNIMFEKHIVALQDLLAFGIKKDKDGAVNSEAKQMVFNVLLAINSNRHYHRDPLQYRAAIPYLTPKSQKKANDLITSLEQEQKNVAAQEISLREEAFAYSKDPALPPGFISSKDLFVELKKNSVVRKAGGVDKIWLSRSEEIAFHNLLASKFNDVFREVGKEDAFSLKAIPHVAAYFREHWKEKTFPMFDEPNGLKNYLTALVPQEKAKAKKGEERTVPERKHNEQTATNADDRSREKNSSSSIPNFSHALASERETVASERKGERITSR